MRKTIAVLLIASIISAGCAHTTANPVLLAQPGDETKSCDAITNEMQQMVQARATAEQDRNNQIAGNVALGVAGIFLIVPWFFMDTGNAATVEERAAQARYQRLNQMAIDKKCPATSLQVAAPSGPDAKPISTSTTVPVIPATTTETQNPSTPKPTGTTLVVTGLKEQSKYQIQAEDVAKGSGCNPPSAAMTSKGAGAETFIVGCPNGTSLAINCDFDGCRVLK